MKKVLVLEDEANIRSFVVINLRRSGYEPIEADCGEMALEQLRRTVDSQLDVAEHNKCADVEVVSDLAERQITF